MNLKLLLFTKNVKQVALAHELGVDPSLLSSHVNGWSKLPLRYHHKFCKLLDIDLEAYKKGIIREIK